MIAKGYWNGWNKEFSDAVYSVDVLGNYLWTFDFADKYNQVFQLFR